MLVRSNVQLAYVRQVDVEQTALVLPQSLQLPDAYHLGLAISLRYAVGEANVFVAAVNAISCLIQIDIIKGTSVNAILLVVHWVPMKMAIFCRVLGMGPADATLNAGVILAILGLTVNVLMLPILALLLERVCCALVLGSVSVALVYVMIIPLDQELTVKIVCLVRDLARG
jgi:hypothetical protein